MHWTPQLARDTLADLTQDCCLPLDPGEVIPGKGHFLRHGHVIIGDIALRGFKDKGRWKYDDRDVRRAGQALAAVDVDHHDLIEIQVPRPLLAGETDAAESWNRADWRRTLSSWMHSAALQKELDEGRDWSGLAEIGENGLPGRLTMAEFTAQFGSRSVAGTRPLDLLSWSGTHWLLPRAYADLLDRSDTLDLTLADKARICSGCQQQRPRNSWAGWRTPTASGYVTLCPACSKAAYPHYEGHLRGVAYSSLRRTLRADEYLCQLCADSRAFSWDHCHDHGYVRGPLCASCNTFEGKGVSFLSGEGSVLHLLECPGCREQRTLPRRFHLDVVRSHLETSERHGRCRQRPRVHNAELTQGVHRFSLACYSHAYISTWTKELSTADVANLVRAFVDNALSSAPEA